MSSPSPTSTRKPSSDVAFSASVKAVQLEKGSRDAYARVERGGGFETAITPELHAFIAAQTSVFLATANAEHQPYIQHRGGPPGFLRVPDEHTIAFADYRGNKQYITTGNLLDNPKVHLFLIDYARRQRVKVWGDARVVGLADDPELVQSLMPKDYKAHVEQAIVIRVSAWDANCPQHIPQRFEAEDVRKTLAAKDARIAELEAALRTASSARRR
jgi:predicted pyridoxine 5'-phosphate oxidase superfamily flavin-nucleotide-binding protein